jgi:hypothetical protein
MNTFIDVMASYDTRTENGMPTHATSGDLVLDWFFWMGGARGKDADEIVGRFYAALSTNRHFAMRSLFALRNIRGGMGERRTFRIVLRWLATHDPDLVLDNLTLIPHFGRWDDLFVLFGLPLWEQASDLMLSALKAGDRLCAKWMPREGKALDVVAKDLMTRWDLTPRQYRKLLAGNTQVVETQMCKRQWGEIKYEGVPSIAFKRYRKAFARHDSTRFGEFLAAAINGETKINASAIFPHTIIEKAVNSYVNEDERLAMEAQWVNLPKYDIPGGTLVVADVSGSMRGEPIAVAVGMGLYFAEQLKGAFHNVICTFSQNSSFVQVNGNIVQRIIQTKRLDWDMNTNVAMVFMKMLSTAVATQLPPEQMPTTVLIISDMQFDECTAWGTSLGALELIRSSYKRAGYPMPNLVFWNVRSSIGIPAKMKEDGVVLLSGFSPAIITSLMKGEVNPHAMMVRVLMDPMYDVVVTRATVDRV